MSTSSVSSTTSTSSSITSDTLSSLTSDDFLTLFLTELQNQDPLEPTDTSDLLNQITQIKAIATDSELSDTLSSVALQQQLYTGQSLINATVTGTNSDGDSITGTVDSISIADDEVSVCIGDESISLSNITEIQATE